MAATLPSRLAASGTGLLRVAVLGSLVVIATALAFEHLGGYRPCPLCLQQRYAYYFALPAGLVALLACRTGYVPAGRLLVALIVLGYLANAGLGVYHAGAEWKFWPGPATCAAGADALTRSAGSILERLETARVIRCDEAPWRTLGLSFAGWNVAASLALAGLAAAAFATWPLKTSPR